MRPIRTPKECVDGHTVNVKKNKQLSVHRKKSENQKLISGGWRERHGALSEGSLTFFRPILPLNLFYAFRHRGPIHLSSLPSLLSLPAQLSLFCHATNPLVYLHQPFGFFIDLENERKNPDRPYYENRSRTQSRKEGQTEPEIKCEVCVLSLAHSYHPSKRDWCS